MIIRRRNFFYGNETGPLSSNVATSFSQDDLFLSGILETTVTTSNIANGVVRSNNGRAQTVTYKGLCRGANAESTIQPVSAQTNAFT
jgi:hypothetical protein